MRYCEAALLLIMTGRVDASDLTVIPGIIASMAQGDVAMHCLLSTRHSPLWYMVSSVGT